MALRVQRLNRMGWRLQGMVAALVLGAIPAFALEPLPTCYGSESGMETYGSTPLERFVRSEDQHSSGVIVEHYQARDELTSSGAYRSTAPVAALEGFDGIRVIHCATGRFFAIRIEQSSGAAAAALAATEFLRGDVRNGKAIGVRALAQAVRAVYGEVLELRETAETCGCNQYFSEMRPKGMTAFGDRTDTTRD
ncbi:MAG: hypothetical protein MUE52_20925 [Tabrizicola sp.]|jgi:hypothetical protein|nr:hypothetical protein [Tabrizicola sp.]